MTSKSLSELSPKRKRKRWPGSASKGMVAQCPSGYHGENGRCVRVSGSERARTRRVKKKWSRSGAGKMSFKRSKRYARVFGDSVERLEHLIQEARSALGIQDADT